MGCCNLQAFAGTITGNHLITRIDEKSLQVGVRALANVACDFLEAKRTAA